jgi:hypothetical protein
MEERRQQILRGQLASMGYSAEQVRQAVAGGPSAVAALKAAPPATTTPIASAQLEQMGFSKFNSAAALYESGGDQEKAVELLVSGWLPSVCTFELDSDQQRNVTAGLSEIPVVSQLSVNEEWNPLSSKSCSLCCIDSGILPGIDCRSGQHFICTACFVDHVMRAPSHVDLKCPVTACTSAPWSNGMIAQNVPEEVFNAYLARKHQHQELGFKQREVKLREQLEHEARRARDQAEAQARDQAELQAHVAQADQQARTQAAHAQAAQAELASLRSQAAFIPSYWGVPPQAPRRWNLSGVTHPEFSVLEAVVRLPSGHALGGRDMRQAGGHSGFKLCAAWRVENHNLFAKFETEKRRVQSMLQSGAIPGTHERLALRRPFFESMRQLPGKLDENVNEVYLVHGTKPDTVLSVIANGLNERFSGGLFGHGTYFAEDVAKNDQYVTIDEKQGDYPELHRELYTPSKLLHPQRVYYVFVCRVVAGRFCRTSDGETQMDAPSRSTLWSSSKRELAAIPGTLPPEPFHALIAEVGGRINRHREIVSFHGDRIYPEYLLAYQRV